MVSCPWCSHHVKIDCVSDVLEKYAGCILGMCRRGLIRVVAGSTPLRNVRNTNAQNKINITVCMQRIEQ